MGVNGDGRFGRDIDTQHESKVITCLIYHRAHHWHIGNFVAATCLGLDLGAAHPSADRDPRQGQLLRRRHLHGARIFRVPAGSYFPSRSTPGLQGARHSRVLMGYGHLRRGGRRPVDSIDGVPNGRYCLVTRTDYKDFVPEMAQRDNARHTVIALRGDTVRKIRDRTC